VIKVQSFDLKLDTIEAIDLPILRQWRNDPEIYKWCRQNDLINESQQDLWFHNQSMDPKIRMYLIKTILDTPVGVCGLTDIDLINQRAEFSLYIGKEHQRKGYAKEALKALLAKGFSSMPLNLIWGETFDGNPAARLFEEIGFKKEGIRRDFYFKDGKYIDAILYSIKRGEFHE